jgi:hypothetical protein
MRCLVLGVAILVGGCVYPYGHYGYPYYPPPYYARPYPPTYQQQPPITSYRSQPTTLQLPDAYQPSPEPLPPADVGQSPDPAQLETSQQEPERLYPEPNNEPPPALLAARLTDGTCDPRRASRGQRRMAARREIAPGASSAASAARTPLPDRVIAPASTNDLHLIRRQVVRRMTAQAAPSPVPLRPPSPFEAGGAPVPSDRCSACDQLGCR